jgi:hypothetical protein
LDGVVRVDAGEDQHVRCDQAHPLTASASVEPASASAPGISLATSSARSAAQSSPGENETSRALRKRLISTRVTPKLLEGRAGFTFGVRAYATSRAPASPPSTRHVRRRHPPRSLPARPESPRKMTSRIQ